MRAVNSASASGTASTQRRLRFLSPRDYGIGLVLVGLVIFLAVATSKFLTGQNLVNILDQASVPGIVACGATLTIISGVFDLSIGAVYALTAILCVMLANHVGTGLAFAGAIIIGAVIGLVNGSLVALARINSFIATLATGIVYTGLATVITKGQIVSTTKPGFGVMNNTTPIGGITVPSWLFIGVVVVTGLLLSSSAYGRALYAIGGNREAARLSGIRVPLDHIVVFGISGACAGAAGLIDASRTSSAQPSMGSTLALTAIAATVVGGTSILGGEGAIWRAVIGVLILELISNGFDLLGINPIYQSVVQGGLVLLAVGLDQVLRRRE